MNEQKLLKKKNVKNESANKKELPAYILVCQQLFYYILIIQRLAFQPLRLHSSASGYGSFYCFQTLRLLYHL